MPKTHLVAYCGVMRPEQLDHAVVHAYLRLRPSWRQDGPPSRRLDHAYIFRSPVPGMEIGDVFELTIASESPLRFDTGAPVWIDRVPEGVERRWRSASREAELFEPPKLDATEAAILHLRATYFGISEGSRAAWLDRVIGRIKQP